MRRATNIAWDNEWILRNRDKYSVISEFHDAYVKEVDSTIQRQAFRTHLTRMRIYSGSTWTEEEREWLRDNFHRLGSLKCEKPFYERFGKHRGSASLQAEANRLGLLVDADVVEANRRYTRRVPIGTIVDDGESYLKIKTGKGSSGWERLHRHIYEEEHGAIPKGHKIVFLDGDRQNYDLENMVAVPSSYLALMNKLKLKSSDPEITKTSLAWCDLYVVLKTSNFVVE